MYLYYFTSASFSKAQHLRQSKKIKTGFRKSVGDFYSQKQTLLAGLRSPV
jgi:hypothetical protein